MILQMSAHKYDPNEFIMVLSSSYIQQYILQIDCNVPFRGKNSAHFFSSLSIAIFIYSITLFDDSFAPMCHTAYILRMINALLGPDSIVVRLAIDCASVRARQRKTVYFVYVCS